MMDLDELRYVNRQATLLAAADRAVPMLVEADELAEWKAGHLDDFGMPYIGYRCPRGYRRVNLADWVVSSEYICGLDCWYGSDKHVRGLTVVSQIGKTAFFVDKSGFGKPSEPALTLEEFVRVMRPGYYYAVVEEGEFQVKVGVFSRSN
jgi:hypothetical protein